MIETVIPLNDLKRHYGGIRPVLEEAIGRVLSNGWFILGPEVEAFEREFAAYCGVPHCVGVANGTDALEIGLRALGISPGDEVITVANAGMYSTTAIRAIGAVPVFAEIDPITLTIDPAVLPGLITSRTRAVVVTHLFGRMANMPELSVCVRRHGLAIVEDCAQAHGAQMAGIRAGSWGDIGCFSFYPTKNLGALGDGGAIVTSDAQLDERARCLRQYGWTQKYASGITGGRNSRLDELQAAVLRAQLPCLEDWNQSRRQIASQYQFHLDESSLQLPAPSNPGEMVYHLYVIQADQRDLLRAALKKVGVGADIHYPIPDHLQSSCFDLGYQPGTLPQTELAADRILTLPCFPELSAEEVGRVCCTVKEFLHDC
jgi:dTDP-4-amino-4,6-dideoxygalactose transaminase